MAPYTMTIHIVNDTQYSVCPIGASTMCGLDGETNLVALPVAPRSSGDLKISKSGGIEGLFTAVSWWVGSVFWDKDNKGRFSVYTEMTAFPNQKPKVVLQDASGFSLEQFKDPGTQSLADTYHRLLNSEIPPGPDVIEYDDVRVQIERLTLAFPDWFCRVIISDIDPHVPSFQEASEVGSSVHRA